jgi:hypothetical protein
MVPWEMVVATTQRVLSDAIVTTAEGRPYVRHSASRLEEVVASSSLSLPLAEVLAEVSLNLWLSVGDRRRATDALARYVSVTASRPELVQYFREMIRRGGNA